MLPAYARLPTDRELLPEGAERSDPERLAEEPPCESRGLSPTFAREIIDAQSRLPPAHEEAVAFCTLRDDLVSVAAIGERVPTARVRPYDGVDEFFSSRRRESILPDVLAALETGPAAV
jgi:hypothetical protein